MAGSNFELVRVGPPETLSPIEKEIDLLNSRLDPFASLERIWPTQSRRNE
jgi:hypothetical protein